MVVRVPSWLSTVDELAVRSSTRSVGGGGAEGSDGLVGASGAAVCVGAAAAGSGPAMASSVMVRHRLRMAKRRLPVPLPATPVSSAMTSAQKAVGVIGDARD